MKVEDEDGDERERANEGPERRKRRGVRELVGGIWIFEAKGEEEVEMGCRRREGMEL